MKKQKNKLLQQLKILMGIAWIIFSLILLFLTYDKIQWVKSVFFMLDLSESMNTQDIKSEEGKKTRLEWAKSLITQTINEYKKQHWQLSRWLIIFNDKKSLIKVPPTQNTDFLLQTLSSLNTNSIKWSEKNYNIWHEKEALWFENSKNIFIIVTDGNKKQNSLISKNGTRIIIGIWSENGWVVRQADGTIIKNEHNEEMYSSIDMQNIKEWASWKNSSYKIFDTIENNTIIPWKFLQEEEKNFFTKQVITIMTIVTVIIIL